jgi:hypothetical protein
VDFSIRRLQLPPTLQQDAPRYANDVAIMLQATKMFLQEKR